MVKIIVVETIIIITKAITLMRITTKIVTKIKE